MGRPRHDPDPLERRQVEALAGYGVPESESAAMIGIDAKTLRKHYRHELDHGHAKANAKVAENLFRKATGDGRESVTAAIFWLKARARWKEVSVHEHGGVPGQPVEEVRRIVLAPLQPVQHEERDAAPATEPGDGAEPTFGDGRTVRP